MESPPPPYILDDFKNEAILLAVGRLSDEGEAMAETDANAALESGFAEAEEIISDPDELERFLQRLEEKLKVVPVAGGALSNAPVLVSMVRSYATGEYPDLPIGTVIATVSALLYLLSPIDLIPDGIPVIGYADDAAVICACLNLIQSDLDEYRAWRDAR